MIFSRIFLSHSAGKMKRNLLVFHLISGMEIIFA